MSVQCFFCSEDSWVRDATAKRAAGQTVKGIPSFQCIACRRMMCHLCCGINANVLLSCNIIGGSHDKKYHCASHGALEYHMHGVALSDAYDQHVAWGREKDPSSKHPLVENLGCPSCCMYMCDGNFPTVKCNNDQEAWELESMALAGIVDVFGDNAEYVVKWFKDIYPQNSGGIHERDQVGRMPRLSFKKVKDNDVKNKEKNKRNRVITKQLEEEFGPFSLLRNGSVPSGSPGPSTGLTSEAAPQPGATPRTGQQQQARGKENELPAYTSIMLHNKRKSRPGAKQRKRLKSHQTQVWKASNHTSDHTSAGTLGREGTIASEFNRRSSWPPIVDPTWSIDGSYIIAGYLVPCRVFTEMVTSMGKQWCHEEGLLHCVIQLVEGSKLTFGEVHDYPKKYSKGEPTYYRGEVQVPSHGDPEVLRDDPVDTICMTYPNATSDDLQRFGLGTADMALQCTIVSPYATSKERKEKMWDPYPEADAFMFFVSPHSKEPRKSLLSDWKTTKDKERLVAHLSEDRMSQEIEFSTPANHLAMGFVRPGVAPMELGFDPATSRRKRVKRAESICRLMKTKVIGTKEDKMMLSYQRSGGAYGKFDLNCPRFLNFLHRQSMYPRSRNACLILGMNRKDKCGFYLFSRRKGDLVYRKFGKDQRRFPSGPVNCCWYNTPFEGGVAQLTDSDLETDRFFYAFPYCKVIAAKIMAHLNQKIRMGQEKGELFPFSTTLFAPLAVYKMEREVELCRLFAGLDGRKLPWYHFMALRCMYTINGAPVGFHTDAFGSSPGKIKTLVESNPAISSALEQWPQHQSVDPEVSLAWQKIWKMRSVTDGIENLVRLVKDRSYDCKGNVLPGVGGCDGETVWTLLDWNTAETRMRRNEFRNLVAQIGDDDLQRLDRVTTQNMITVLDRLDVDQRQRLITEYFDRHVNILRGTQIEAADHTQATLQNLLALNPGPRRGAQAGGTGAAAGRVGAAAGGTGNAAGGATGRASSGTGGGAVARRARAGHRDTGGGRAASTRRVSAGGTASSTSLRSQRAARRAERNTDSIQDVAARRGAERQPRRTRPGIEIERRNENIQRLLEEGRDP